MEILVGVIIALVMVNLLVYTLTKARTVNHAIRVTVRPDNDLRFTLFEDGAKNGGLYMAAYATREGR